jgi:hypothetical protein
MSRARGRRARCARSSVAAVASLAIRSALSENAAADDGPTTDEVSVRGMPRELRATAVEVDAAEARRQAGTEGDPVKVIEDLPGTARPSFGSGQLVVWGAAPEDTRTYVDGVEVPAIFHGSGLRSVLSADLVRDVTLSPGAYGVDYGRAIGGQLRVETKDLPYEGVHGSLGADTLDASGMLTAAIGDRVRVGIAARYGWIDRVLQAVDAPDVGDFFAVPAYRDYQAKAQVDLRPGESLDVVVLGSGDDLTRNIPNVDPAQARSQVTSSDFERVYLHYRRKLEDGAEVDVVPWFGRDASSLDDQFGGTPARLDQSAWRWGLRGAHRSRWSSWATLDLGIDADGSHAHLHRDGSLTIPPREGDITVFGQPPGNDVNSDTWDTAIIDIAPSAQVEISAGPLAVTAGLRFDAYLLDASRRTPRVGETPSIGVAQADGELEPRASARLRLSRRVSLLAAAGLYSQAPAAADLSAVFGTPTLGPEHADHATFGESFQVTPTLSADVTAFYRWMSDLVVRDPAPTPQLAAALLQDGVGRSFGVQALLRQRMWRGFSGWIAYTISRSERRDAPGAAWRLFDGDEPHVLTVVLSQDLGAWTFAARFRYARGLPRTPVVGAAYDAKDDLYQPIFGAQNSERLPDFWQLDARVDRSFRLGSSARLLLYVEGLNVTDRANAEEYVYSADYSRRGTISGLPIIAVVGARVER